MQEKGNVVSHAACWSDNANRGHSLAKSFIPPVLTYSHSPALNVARASEMVTVSAELTAHLWGGDMVKFGMSYA